MKKLTTRIFAAVACAACVLSAAIAAPEETEPLDPETVAAVKTLMKTLQVEKQMGPVMEGMKKMQDSMIEQQELPFGAQ